jgi:hypothetical protein
MERRRWPRLNLQLGVSFSETDEASQPLGMGITANVSAGGAFFLTGDWRELSAGQGVFLRLSGMSRYNDGPLFRTLGGKAHVLRVAPPGAARRDKGGVAVQFDERPQVELYDVPA